MTEPSHQEHEDPPDPRFLLANERTLLAWLRTSLAFVATGLALVALRHEHFSSDWLMLAAVVSCVIGVIAASWAYVRWRSVDQAIRNRTAIKPPNIGPVLVVGIVILAGTGIMAIVTVL